MKTHIATKKEHRCDACGKKIPIGARYFYDDGTREHTNCEDFTDQPVMERWFNQNRKHGEKKYSYPDELDEYGRLK